MSIGPYGWRNTEAALACAPIGALHRRLLLPLRPRRARARLAASEAGTAHTSTGGTRGERGLVGGGRRDPLGHRLGLREGRRSDGLGPLGRASVTQGAGRLLGDLGAGLLTTTSSHDGTYLLPAPVRDQAFPAPVTDTCSACFSRAPGVLSVRPTVLRCRCGRPARAPCWWRAHGRGLNSSAAGSTDSGSCLHRRVLRQVKSEGSVGVVSGFLPSRAPEWWRSRRRKKLYCRASRAARVLARRTRNYEAASLSFGTSTQPGCVHGGRGFRRLTLLCDSTRASMSTWTSASRIFLRALSEKPRCFVRLNLNS